MCDTAVPSATARVISTPDGPLKFAEDLPLIRETEFLSLLLFFSCGSPQEK